MFLIDVMEDHLVLMAIAVVLVLALCCWIWRSE